MTQNDHEAWNADNYPGTLQLCECCGEETGRCEEDSMYSDDGDIGPMCEDCYKCNNPGSEGKINA